MNATPTVLAAILLAGCAMSVDEAASWEALDAASISVSGTSAYASLTSDTDWTLTKTGSIDTTMSTVAWQVTAAEGTAVSEMLLLEGTLTVTNAGTGAATLGNIVANVQTRSGSRWVTRSSDIADATDGDAATSADIFAPASSENRASFSENGASGPLQFSDGSASFSLVPEITIPPHTTRTIRFSAAYDNDVLDLTVGTAIRIEVIVSFGNATANGNSGADIDINGNGAIDPDEAHVRSVPFRATLVVPAQTPGSSIVTLSDAQSDITTTGTVSFSDLVIDLGATSGTVTARCDGGTDGGTITNCAHLTSPTLSREACDTETIPPNVCTPGAPGCGWSDGDLTTYPQSVWGNDATSAAALLMSQFFSVYPLVLEVGVHGTAGFSIIFRLVDAVQAYLPAVGAPAPLNSDLLDPTSSSSGVFGGEMVALALNIDFSDVGKMPANATVHFGDLPLCNNTIAPALDGMTVREILQIGDTLLGSGTSIVEIGELTVMVNSLNGSFNDGVVSAFAQQSLFNAASCP